MREKDAYTLFKAGHDTLEIAARLRIHEAEALRRVNRARAWERDLDFTTQPSPYHTSPSRAWRDTGIAIRNGHTH